MLSILRFPDGSSARPYIIGVVAQHDNGVAVATTSGAQIVFIIEHHPQVRLKIAETINACVDAGKNFVQPDWVALFAQWRAEVAPQTA